mmetsp:Transcript_22392/g.53317  ORF Transcript_22392/g.53317 Transcript_22392/m.53317 type:complete len:165 (+) Transcript_22392:73-567(+)
MARRREESYSYSDSRSPSRERRRKRRRRHRSRRRRRGGGKRGSTVDRFIRENELNESASARLRGASKEVRDACIEQGWNVIENARNASAVVISRIKKIEDSFNRSRSRSPVRDKGPPDGETVRDGDWYCKSCNAHNFARRTECFKCNTLRGRRRRSRSRSRSRS